MNSSGRDSGLHHERWPCCQNGEDRPGVWPMARPSRKSNERLHCHNRSGFMSTSCSTVSGILHCSPPWQLNVRPLHHCRTTTQPWRSHKDPCFCPCNRLSKVDVCYTSGTFISLWDHFSCSGAARYFTITSHRFVLKEGFTRCICLHRFGHNQIITRPRQARRDISFLISTKDNRADLEKHLCNPFTLIR